MTRHRQNKNKNNKRKQTHVSTDRCPPKKKLAHAEDTSNTTATEDHDLVYWTNQRFQSDSEGELETSMEVQPLEQILNFCELEWNIHKFSNNK